MKLKDRVKAARVHAKLTQGELAELVKEMPGVDSFSQQSLTKLESGIAKKSAFLTHIAYATGTNPYWLALGLGDMTDRKVAEPPVGYHVSGLAREFLTHFSNLEDDAQKELLRLAKLLLRYQRKQGEEPSLDFDYGDIDHPQKKEA